MLVLSRRKNESIHIGNNIVIKISRINGARVQLAIEAPADVKVRRGELIRPASRTVLPPQAILRAVNAPLAS